MEVAERAAVLQETQQRNPMLLIGDDFNVSATIITIYNTLDMERESGAEITHEEIMDRIDRMLVIMYEGLV